MLPSYLEGMVCEVLIFISLFFCPSSDSRLVPKGDVLIPLDATHLESRINALFMFPTIT